MMVSMTVEASWGSPSVLKSRAVSMELPAVRTSHQNPLVPADGQGQAVLQGATSGLLQQLTFAL